MALDHHLRAIAVIASTLGIAGNFGTWLGYLGSFATPLAGILIAHFWILNSVNSKSYKYPVGFRWTAFAAWVVGFIVCRYVVNNQAAIPVPSSICGMAVGIILYPILASIFKTDDAKCEAFTIQS